jgi:prolyl oligopeptidase
VAIRPPPPLTRVEDVVEVLHGVAVHDPYRWLEDESASEVQEWVARQQAYARAYLDALPERPAIEARLRQAMDVGTLGPSRPRGRYRFFLRRAAGADQACLWVDDGAGERVLVDPNPMSADGATAIDYWYASDDGELVAVGISEAGSEDSVLSLVATATGRTLPDRIQRCRWSAIAFEPGGDAFLYTRGPAPGSVPDSQLNYHRHLFRHLIGNDPEADPDLFGAQRDKTHFPVAVSLSADGRWTALTIAPGYDRTVVFLRAAGGEFESVFEGPPHQVLPWFAGDRLLAVTNLGAPNYRLVEIDPRRPGSEHWRELVPEGDDVLLEAAVARDGMALHRMRAGRSRVEVHDLDGRHRHSVAVPEFCSLLGMGADARLEPVYVTLEEFTRPARTSRLDLAAGDRVEIDALRPPAGFDPDAFAVRQDWYESKDGTRVPIFLVGRQAGAGPVAMTGYGGFNLPRQPQWLPYLVPLLEAGGVFALPSLRGGSEFGEAWHRAGMLGGKQNVFDDFIAAAEWLIAQGLCTSEQLGIVGRSNGGLLVGAAMTQRPDLFGAVVCGVPLLDMVRYERFKVAQLWSPEYGTAADPEQFRWLYAYSPYHHVEPGARYPPTLITTGEGDSRVDPMHARKMAALLQAADPGGLTLLRVDTRAGHGQGKPVAKLVPEEADAWAFLLHHVRSSRDA